MNIKRCKPWGCTHTHTHTQVFLTKISERRKLVYNFLLRSKGGSRELLEVSMLPRDYNG